MSYVSLSVNPKLASAIIPEITVYIDGYICSPNNKRDYDIKGHYVSKVKSGQHRLIVREKNPHVDPRAESNTLYFDIQKNEIHNFYLDVVDNNLVLKEHATAIIEDNGVSLEDAFCYWLEKELEQIPDPLPQGVMFFLTSNLEAHLFRSDNFSDQIEFDTDIDTQLGDSFFKITPDITENDDECKEIVSSLIKKYLAAKSPGAERLLKTEGIGVIFSSGSSTIVHWTVPKQRSNKPKVMTVEDADFYFWSFLSSVPERIYCARVDDDSGLSSMKLRLGRVFPSHDYTFILKTSASIEDLLQFPCIVTQLDVPVVSPSVQSALSKQLGDAIEWINVTIKTSNGDITDYKAMNILTLVEGSIDKDKSLFERSGDEQPLVPFYSKNPLENLDIGREKNDKLVILISKNLCQLLVPIIGTNTRILTTEQAIKARYI